WELPIFLKGFKKELTEDDLYAPLKQYESKRLGDKLEQLWQEEEDFREHPSLWRALIRMFGLEFIVYGIVFYSVDVCVIILQPIFLNKLLDYFVPNQAAITEYQAYWYGSSIVLLSFLRVLVFHWTRLELSAFGMKVRVACCSLIYRRCLRLKKNMFRRVTVGQMVNLFSNDVNRFDLVFIFLHNLWTGPLEVVVTACYLDVTLVYMAKMISACRKRIATRTDNRIRLMNDILCGIKVIKMYTWEKPFEKLVAAARDLELNEIKIANLLRVLNYILAIFTVKLSLFICILLAVLNHPPLTAQYVYVTTYIYERVKMSMTVLFSLTLFQLSETRISVQRIQEFLTVDKSKRKNLVKKMKKSHKVTSGCILKSNVIDGELVGIYAENIRVRWDSSHSNDTLNNVTFSAFPGEVVGVIGAAGGGKSTLLQVILKEIPLMKGTLYVKGAVSYAAQEPWVFSASIRQNILFGEEMDEEKFRKVIKICGLEHDLSVFPYGEHTLVGERGVMLSGGQRARISLARAVYRDADIYLLDDPLSAVDVRVAEVIFSECVLGYLKDKCVVLVTHQLQFVKRMNRVYILENGKLIENGNYEELDCLQEGKNNLDADKSTILKKSDLPTLIKEHRSTGNVSKKIYKNYCLAGGSWFYNCMVIFSFIMIHVVLRNATEYFLNFWINLDPKQNFLSTDNCLYIYGALIVFLALMTLIGVYVFVTYITNASRNLHNGMFVRTLYGTMEFFNNHSSGRILNRFSKDIGFIDETIPLFLADTATSFLIFLGLNLLISTVNYWLIIPIIAMVIIFYCYNFVHQTTNRNVKRTEGIMRSPVFSHLTASLQGLTTIRAFNRQKMLEQEFDNHQDLHTSAFYLSLACYSSLGFWVDIICTIYIGLIILSFFLLGSDVHIGNVGLAITQSIVLVGTVQHGMKNWSNLDTQMTAVERVVEYRELAPEANEGNITPPESWPSDGTISFDSVSMRYSSDTSFVLEQVSFQINSGEKIGVVGRTGAGKTSLISVLFRLFNFEGKVTIDEVDTKSVPLNILRSKISTIPQEPVLFLGTLRKNLDPFEEFSDSQLWNALDEVELKKAVSDLPSGLDSAVSEGGSNFSVGQRQLLCLVRIMLRRTRIIVLDEATANVDFKTDKLIQSTIRNKFKDCTVLTIAHRLNTVMDSDRVLVMDNGRVVEFDDPRTLLKNPNGLFYEYLNRKDYN
ncbi:ABC tran domain containing protein, partial [Asbolus verrucosus]